MPNTTLPSTARETLEQARNAANPAPRVSLTELARTTEWRKRMVEYAVVEICDHNETAGYLVSPQGMNDLLYTIEELEQALEQAHIAAVVEARGNTDNWQSGADLTASALALMRSEGHDRNRAHAS